MQKISTFLWFDNQARDAAKFYLKTFQNSKLKSDTKLEDTPSGTVDIVNIELEGQEFSLMSAGPHFKINPSISFMVNFDPAQDNDAIKKIDQVWKKLIEGGKALMDIGEYPWSKRYGWVEDKFGVSWQLMLQKEKTDQKIIPTLLFTKKSSGKAKQAVEFYTKVFSNSKIITTVPYEKGELPGEEITNMIKYSLFALENQKFTAMDGGKAHEFAFNEAVSFVVDCIDQKETDYFWDALSKDGQTSQCGWLKDKFGVSWQVVPRALNELMSKDKSGQIMQAMLKMQKIIIKDLEKASKED
jgi:predicted 3-demethylubiquinone-9 3-methyltransferase (glyoxalase superfamily)